MTFVELLKSKGIENADDYKFLDENKHLGNNIHLLVYGGSKAYGTNLPTSDTDIRGFATNKAEDLLCGRDFETVVNETTDTTIYSFDKLLGLLINCNPNTIEMLFVREEDILYVDELGRELLDNRHIFLSNKCIGTFGGYANQQLYRLRQKTLSALTKEEYEEHIVKVINGMRKHLENEFGNVFIDIKRDNIGLYADIKETTVEIDKLGGLLSEINNVIREYNKRSARNDKALAHNKINKHAMHLIRLYKMAIELLSTGTVCTYREKDHDLLMDIRNGKYSLENGELNNDFFDLVNNAESMFNEAQNNSVLSDKPDYEKIDKLHFDINRRIVTN